MLQIVSLFVLVILFPVTLTAQQIKAALYLDRKAAVPDWFEYSPKDKGLVTVGPMSRASSRNVGVTKYDTDFKKQWTKQLYSQQGRERIDHVAVLGENIIVFVAEDHPKEDVVSIGAYQVDLSGKILGERKEISRSPRNRKGKEPLRYSVSHNKKKLMCFRKEGEKGGKEKLKFFVFDESFRKPEEAGLELPYLAEQFDIRVVRVGNEGSIFVLGRINKTDNEGIEKWQYTLFHYSPQTQKAVEIPLKFADAWVIDLTFRIDRDQQILVAGYYSKRGGEGVAGIVYQRLDAVTHKALVVTQYPFSEDFKGRYLTQRQLEKGKELENLYLDNILPKSDGGVLLLGEQYYVTSSTYRDLYGYWYTQTFYHYDDVIVTSVSGDGKVEWSTVVYKRQVSENPAQLSYFEVVSGEKLYLFYEYREKEIGNNVFSQSIDLQGVLSNRKPFLVDYHSTNIFYRSLCEQINNQEAYLVYFQQKRKVFTLLKIGFPG